ncbi:uracil-xanthine permease family protein [Paenibacillus aestuarii]|uniref:Uracil-xanthine permease family protein n=1 Tax=Paenibacillus aestuarii TaxID=516965 RepID=A0ABW0K139_9BACL
MTVNTVNQIETERPMNISDVTDEKPRIVTNLLLGLQHVFVSNVWLDPLFIAAMIGLPLAASSNLVNAIFIAAGVVTLTQATRLAKLPIVQGPSAAFDSLMISAGKANSLAAASGGILISAAIVFIMSITGLIGKLQRWFTPAVSGTVICVVGVALSHFTMYEFLGGSPGTPSFLSSTTLSLSIPTALIVLVLSHFGRGWIRRYAFLIALLAGDVIAAMLGIMDTSSLSSKSWLGFPEFLPYGALTFNGGMTVTFLIAYLVAVIEAMGVYQAAAETAHIRLDAKRIRLGFAGEAAGSMLSAFLGGFPTTAYAQNVGLLRLTGSGSRYPVIAAGILFLVLGVVPKAGALLALTPEAVVGGLFLPAAAGLFMSGISLLMRMEKTEANFTIVGLSLLLAIALPGNFTDMPGVWGTILSNQILIGACSVLLLQTVLSSLPKWLRKKKGAE